MFIETIYRQYPKIAGEIISYLKNTMMLPADIIKSHDIVVVAIIEDYLYNAHFITITIDPKVHYIYSYDALVYEQNNIDTNIVEIKKDIIMKVIKTYLN